jgi:Ca-activated chloride channel family protein
VKLALEHHLVTEHTSLVAVDTTPTNLDPQSCKPELVPINLPAGWGGVENGSLPQTGTSAALSMLIGAALLLAAIVIRKL